MATEGRDLQHPLSAPSLGSETDLLKCALDNLSEAVVVVGLDGVVLYANHLAASLLSVPVDKAVGMPCAKLLECGASEQGCCALDPLTAAGPGARHTVHCGALRATSSLLVDSQKQSGAVVMVLRDQPVEVGTAPRSDGFSLRDLVGRSTAVRRIADTVRRLANSDVPVLITGESGTGKELIARALHGSSRRKNKPFVAVNCGAIPTELAESELFGHVRGAFTGAVRDRKGAAEAAQGGTFFLDEVGDLAVSVQPTLLRLLQDKTYQVVGDPRTRSADIRVVAATNVELDKAVENGSFRRDLFYRLRVVPIHIPALRERPEDIAPLCSILLSRRSVSAGRIPMRLTASAMQVFEKYPWPGNVRELINVIDYLVALCTEEVVDRADLPADFEAGRVVGALPRGRYSSVTDAGKEAMQIQQSLERNDFHRLRTATELGMDRVTLYRKMKEFGIEMGRSRIR